MNMQHTLITAHSGCEGTPDNSIASVLAGICAGADCVEIDVHADPGGKLWLIHDTPSAYAGLASLEEAFAAILEANVAINCDLKHYEAFAPALLLAEAMRIPRELLYFSGSVDVRALAADPSPAKRANILLNTEELCRYLAPSVRGREGEMALIDSRLAEVASLVRSIGVAGLNAPYAFFPHERIAAWRAAGLPLSLWTVNEPEPLAALFAEDLLNITTRTVSSAVRIRSEIERTA